ncbi:MAG: hypothetical protein A2W19_11725 [Spirochaetes bacterium RBG_16_49_21]|nr:MAG: hypothetical protein A2W19_11725 [Spirochaetes bacterium RBG_16_49_21]
MTSDFQILSGAFAERPTKRRNISIVEYAEKTIIPTGKYRGVQFKHNRAPYLIEPLRLMSPESPIQEVRLMFPAQSGKSTVGELCTMFYIEEYPSEILFVTSNETAAIKWMHRRIEPRATAAGIVFRSQGSESKLTRRTGDTNYSKEFSGGNIDVASALSVAQLTSESKRIIIADEVDRYKLLLDSEQGLTWDVMYARSQAWGDQKKILAISTPTIATISIIAALYEEGDQRLYHVPCSHCGTMQLLDFSAGRGHGLHWEYKNGKIYKKSISLICESPTCQKEIKESSKNKMLNGGEWRASALPIKEGVASFHINGLYSPFLSWYDMALAYEEAKTDPLKKQTFNNLKMGRPHRMSGSQPKVSKIIENRGNYKSGALPDGVLYLTAGVDVQEGSETNEDRARLEMTVLGIGKMNKTWVIEHRIFKGPVMDPYSGAWIAQNQYLLDLIAKGGYRRSDGFGMVPQIYFIDSGSGKVTDVVYQYCSEGVRMYPSKGFSQLKKRKKEAPDEMTGRVIRYRPVRIGNAVLYEVNVNYYKDSIYRRLAIPRQEIEPQRGGFIEFPYDLPESYFDQLVAEERRIDGTFHNPGGRRNEALDCFALCLASSDVWLWSELLNCRATLKAQGYSATELQTVDLMYILDNIERATRRKISA